MSACCAIAMHNGGNGSFYPKLLGLLDCATCLCNTPFVKMSHSVFFGTHWWAFCKRAKWMLHIVEKRLALRFLRVGSEGINVVF